jgi:hypothetical protein
MKGLPNKNITHKNTKWYNYLEDYFNGVLFKKPLKNIRRTSCGRTFGDWMSKRVRLSNLPLIGGSRGS